LWTNEQTAVACFEATRDWLAKFPATVTD
jgi:hypothetical protein